MTENIQFTLRYVGKRFDGGRLPLEVLSDLPAFRELIVAFAKAKWRENHSQRKRLPQNFDKNISFDLVRIEEGSAKPIIEWECENDQENLFEFEGNMSSLIREAFSSTSALIDNAANNIFPSSLSAQHIKALNKLGSDLKEGEKIEFVGSTGKDGNVIYLDDYRRKQLLTHVSETYEKRVQGIGILISNSVDGRITLKTDFGKIDISLPPETVTETFDGNLNSSVQFDIQIELDNNDKYRNVVDVFDVTILESINDISLHKCKERLNELENLGAGWYDGAGEAISAFALQSSRQLIEKFSFICEALKIYPTEEGGVKFELDNNGWDYSIEFLPDGYLEMYGIELNGSNEMAPESFVSLNSDFITLFNTHIKDSEAQ